MYDISSCESCMFAIRISFHAMNMKMHFIWKSPVIWGHNHKHFGLKLMNIWCRNFGLFSHNCISPMLKMFGKCFDQGLEPMPLRTYVKIVIIVPIMACALFPISQNLHYHRLIITNFHWNNIQWHLCKTLRSNMDNDAKRMVSTFETQIHHTE